MNSKKVAGEKAIEYVKDDMVLGLGTGSTAYYSILKLSERIKDGLRIKAVSTSRSTTKLANELGIPLIPLNAADHIDLTIDGADEIDGSLNGIKGGGGALLYEKLVAASSRRVIWVADSSKKVDMLGRFPLPIEVISFSYNHLLNQLNRLNMRPSLRYTNGSIFVTDEGNYIIDLHLNAIENPHELHNRLKLMPGVVETGLFIGMADTVIIGDRDNIEVIDKASNIGKL